MYWYFSYQPRRYDCGGRCTARHRSWWSSFNPKKRNDEEAKVVWVCVIEIYYKYTILYIIWESSPHSLFSILKQRVIRLTPTAKPLTPTAKPWLSSKFLIPLHLPLNSKQMFWALALHYSGWQRAKLFMVANLYIYQFISFHLIWIDLKNCPNFTLGLTLAKNTFHMVTKNSNFCQTRMGNMLL